MRMTTLLKKLLGIQHLLVTGFTIEDGALVIEVRPSWRTPRCSGCTKPRGRDDTLPPRRWRHLDFGGVRVYLRYGLRRVSCRACGVVAEAVPWCELTTTRFTTRFEEAVGFLVQRCDKTSVQEMFSVAWVTVGQIVERVLQRHRPDDPLEGLTVIGIDELSYRKGHKYVTTVTDQLSGRIVWAAEGKSAKTLQSFFDALGAARPRGGRAGDDGHERGLYHGRAADGAAGADCLRPVSCAEVSQRGAGRDAARGMATIARHEHGGRDDGQGPPLAAAEEPLEPDAQADPTPVNAAAGQRPTLSSLPAQGDIRRHPRPPAAHCRQRQAEGVAELGESQSAPWVRQGCPHHPPRTSTTSSPTSAGASPTASSKGCTTRSG